MLHVDYCLLCFFVPYCLLHYLHSELIWATLFIRRGDHKNIGHTGLRRRHVGNGDNCGESKLLRTAGDLVITAENMACMVIEGPATRHSYTLQIHLQALGTITVCPAFRQRLRGGNES